MGHRAEVLALFVALALTQAEATPPTTDAPVAAPEELTPPPPPPDVRAEPQLKPNTLGRQASLFSAPQVPAGLLIGRIGMGLALGSTLGGGLGVGLLFLGGLFTALTSSAGPLIVAGLFATASLAMGTAMGAALFGPDYGRDLADAVPIALVASAISVLAGVTLTFLVPAMGPLIAAIALVFPAVVTPLMVQAFKPDDGPLPAAVVARF